ncbi:MAG TPA: PrsW family intramembrane metalloprotease, partial [Natrialbaceae archaeon]|nr:PrsW family intramembrane metalloprotease [Natrialbaceae archaeon]
LVILSIVPAFLIAAFVWFSDVTTNEPITNLFMTFALGIVLGPFAGVLNVLVPLAVLGLIVAVFLTAIDALSRSISGGAVAPIDPGMAIDPVLVQEMPEIEGALLVVVLALFFYLVVGPVEEGVKLLAVRVYAYRTDDFDAVVDGAVYGAVAGLGFATVENALYITDAFQQVGQAADLFGNGIVAARALAGPGHVIYSAIAGYYLGLAKFNRENAGPIVVKGLLIAAFFHGTYNLLVGIVPGAVADAFPEVTRTMALVGFIVVYDGSIGYFLYRKIRRYRRIYSRVGAREGVEQAIDAELAEFDPPRRQDREPPDGQ